MKTIYSLLLLIICTHVFSQTDEKDNPVFKMEVTIDGKAFMVNEGDTLVVDGKSIVVKTSSSMTFDFGALTFDYPKHFAFQSDKDVAYKTWSLDGHDFVITYMAFIVEVDLNDFTDEMIDKFGKKNCEVAAKETKLGDINLKGKRLEVTLVGQKLTYDIYKIPSKDGFTHLIAFQDTKNDDGSDSAEGKETLALINKTIKLRR